MQQEDTISQPGGNQNSGEPPKQSHDSAEGLGSILSTLLILIVAPLIALLLTAFVFQSYEVDGPSMERTLQNHDRLIVMKTGKTWSRILGTSYIPKRGEIIVFNESPSIEKGTSRRQLIKRVIGLPGEHVVVSGGHITIYNKASPNGFNPDLIGHYGANVAPTTPGNVDITVPEGEVFVCGDNRTNSLDSRAFGTVPSADIIGNLTLRIYPFSTFERFSTTPVN